MSLTLRLFKCVCARELLCCIQFAFLLISNPVLVKSEYIYIQHTTAEAPTGKRMYSRIKQPIMKSFMLLITYRLTFLCADRYRFFSHCLSLSYSFICSYFILFFSLVSLASAIRKLIILVLVEVGFVVV